METEFNLSDLEAEFYLRCDKCRIEESYAEEDDDEDDNKIYSIFHHPKHQFYPCIL